jgi:hypothetical protein
MRLRKHAALMLLLAPVLALRAQEDPVSPIAEAPLYEVELIVFRHLDQRGSTPEASATRPPDAPDAAAVSAGVTDAAVENAYPPLPAQALRLGNIAAKLRRGGPYQLLYYGGWTQGVARQNRAQPTPLPPQASADAGISGAITLYRERYLHVLVDVALLQEAGGQPRIHQGRRLRTQGVHYFDHPQFGVILAVRPVGGGATEEPSDETVPP